MKNFWKSMEETRADKMLELDRTEKLHNEISSLFREDFPGSLSMDGMGADTIRAFVYMDYDAPEEATHEAVKVITKWNGGTAKREFRNDQGTFYWFARKDDVEDAKGKYSELFFIERAAKMNCKIEKVKKEVEVYEAKCE